MSDVLRDLCSLVAIPECFHVLTHETADGYQLVEPKDIPATTPIVSGPVNTFFNSLLIDHLLSAGSGITDVGQVRLFRRSSGFATKDYSLLTIPNRWPYASLSEPGFRPALVNLVAETGVVFFSREYFDRVAAETSLRFSEVPEFHLVPVG